MNFNEKIFFIGAGKMATAIAGGLVMNGLESTLIKAYDPSSAAAEKFNAVCAGECCSNELGREELKNSQVILIAVKPQQLSGALEPLKDHLSGKLIISIAAGVKIKAIEALAPECRVIRVMPNTPALVGEGFSAYCVSDQIKNEDCARVEAIFGGCGKVGRVEEKLMDVVTGLSGSGPAYVFDFIQALADGGVRLGLGRTEALAMAVQTVIGAARLASESGQHPAVLRDQVTSPGGTTAAGLAVLENGAFKGLVAEAVIAAAERSAELGE